MLNNLLESGPTLATVGAGLVAYLVYRSGQRQQDQDAATIVYLQLKESERCIENLNKNGCAIHLQLNPILKKDYWGENKHRLIKYFHADDLDAIDNFFNRALVAEGVRLEARSIMMAGYDEKVRIYQKIAAELAVEHSAKRFVRSNIDKFNIEKKRKFEILDKDYSPFLPNDFSLTAQSELRNIKLIVNSPAGEKLRKLSEGELKRS
ncbi:hypothetical protein [Photobacterium carnosum]|uniref:hypothetical protein n=1 Tax=Photobacterium carnosum TaxID=2023717 RepID=UPI00242AAC22|nr:hypothetical protein [Photobacterium carnosum]